MAGYWRMMRFGATALTLTMLTVGCASTKSMKPMLEEKYSTPSAKVLFIPAYNAEQPNKISIHPTKKISDMFKAIKEKHDEIDWKDEIAVGTFLSSEISKMKKPVDERKERKNYEQKQDNGKMVTPDTFVDSEVAFCLERAVALESMLLEAGFKANLLFLEEKISETEYSMHVLVEQDTKKGILYLDPTYDVSAASVNDYYSKYFLKAQRIRAAEKKWIYPIVPYKDEYDLNYSTLEKEERLDKDFIDIKKEF